MVSIKPAAFYVPNDYDLQALPAGIRDYSAYILNTIHWRWCCWKTDAEGFAHLHAGISRRIIPQAVWPKVRDYLTGFHEDDGFPKVIECTPVVIGKSSRGYRILEQFRKTHRIVCQNDELNRRIARVYGSERGLAPVHRWLRDNLDTLAFDMDRARPIIAKAKPRAEDEFTGDLADYRGRLLGHCERIANRDHYFSRDAYGRVDTPVTSLVKQLRCCLSARGKRLVNIDLANSQPLFLGMFAARFSAMNRMDRRYVLTKRFDEAKQPYHARTLEKLPPRFELPAGLVRYLDVCERGQFYETFMNPADDRDSFKTHFFQGVFFGPNTSKDPRGTTLRKRFRDEFPSVGRALYELKRKEYQRSAHLLQNYESTLFIHGICGRLMRERPALPVFTIHDSILTVPSAVKYVRRVIQDAFRDLGVTPTIREEAYQ